MMKGKNDTIRDKANIENDEIINKKKIKRWSAFAIFLFFAGFAFVIVGAFIQEFKASNAAILPVCILGFLACELISAILLLKLLPDLAILDRDRINNKYSTRTLLTLPLSNEDALVHKLITHQFKATQEGYYQKKQFSFLKDFIYYYAAIIHDYSLENTIQRELHKFDSLEKKGRNFCLLLFVYLDEVGEAEKKQLLEIEKQFITFEAINPYAAATVLVIAIDGSMHTGYLLDIENGKSITLYAHACKFLKKIFYNDPIE